MQPGVALIPPRPAPARLAGPAARLRRNFFATVPNAIASLLLLALLAWLGALLWRWGIADAVFAPDADRCQAARGVGACWGVIAEKGRFILIRRYPHAELLRQLLATVLTLSLFITSCCR